VTVIATSSEADLVARAARAIADSEALLVTAGAGMGVDSGLPDFRGDEGFWRAYPPFRSLGLSFVDLANPRWFVEDPARAWGFYGHRLLLYRATRPHAGFARLLAWTRARRGFVFTSNVDGHFQAAGFPEDAIVECHGSLARLQCIAACGVGLFPATDIRVRVDLETFRASPPLPTCPRCGALARPNVLMFGDSGWDETHTAAQEARFAKWLAGASMQRLAIVECGAGTAVPTVRLLGERLAARGATLVRINVREPEAPRGEIGLSLGAAAATALIEGALVTLTSDPGRTARPS
jgi:NAD-dependent SIR2 family protein deacetylase